MSWLKSGPGNTPCDNNQGKAFIYKIETDCTPYCNLYICACYYYYLSHADWDIKQNLSYTVYHLHVLVLIYFVKKQIGGESAISDKQLGR